MRTLCDMCLANGTAQANEVSTSLEDLLFSHVVSDHWSGQPKPALSAPSGQERSVVLEDVGALPGTSAVLTPCPDSPNDSSPDDCIVAVEHVEQEDEQSEVEAECAFSSSQTF